MCVHQSLPTYDVKVSRGPAVCGGAGLLHTDFMHLAGSLLPWAVLACLLEISYGSIRVAALWLVSLLGGAFSSAVLDAPCQVVRSQLPTRPCIWNPGNAGRSCERDARCSRQRMHACYVYVVTKLCTLCKPTFLL